MITSYLLDWEVYYAENYGRIIKSADNDGNYPGSIFVIPPGSPSMFKAYTYRGLFLTQWSAYFFVDGPSGTNG